MHDVSETLIDPGTGQHAQHMEGRSLARLGRSRPTTLAAIAFGAIFFLVGAIMLAMGVDGYRDGQATKSWSSTTATILSSEVREDVETSRDSRGMERTKSTYRSALRYEYAIDGRTFQGYRIKADDYGGSASRAYDAVNRYPVGAEVTVYYDPADPSQAVLEQGADGTAVYLFGGIGALFSMIGLGAFAFVGVSSRRITGRTPELTPGAAALSWCGAHHRHLTLALPGPESTKSLPRPQSVSQLPRSA